MVNSIDYIIKMKTNSFYSYISFTLIIIIMLSATKSSIDSYQNYYGVESSKSSNLISKIYYFKPINLFNTYTGFETGYGFFGINVSSEFFLNYELFDKNNTYIGTYNFKLNSKEACLRSLSLNRFFLDQLTTKDNIKYDQFITLLLTDMVKYVSKKHSKGETVKLKLYLFNNPSLSALKIQKSKPKLNLIEEIIWKI